MNIKTLIFSTCILLVNSLAFSGQNTVSETKEVLVSSHTEFAKANIDKKCKKLKKKIKSLEEELSRIESTSDQDSQEKRRIKILDKIQKYEEKIDALRLVKLSFETINFNALSL